MKIVHLMGSLRPSGMERMFLSAAAHFQASGLESTIVGQGTIHPFAPQLVDAGFRVESIPSLKTSAGAKAWFALLRSERPDVIHIHTEGAFIVSVLTAKGALPSTPIVRTIHNVFAPSGKARLSRKLQGFAADRAVSRFIAVSPDVQDNEESFGRNSRLIFNWVDDKFFAVRDFRAENGRAATPSAVIVGNSSAIKNQGLALRAVQRSSLKLYFHGDESGATSEEVCILNALEAEGRLLHRGIADPSTSLALGSVFLLPSRHEGMPIALSEALVAGVPAVVNDAPGMQWAKEFPNVSVVPDSQADWDAAVSKVTGIGGRSLRDVPDLPVDLSSSRGAREYVDMYEGLVHKNR